MNLRLSPQTRRVFVLSLPISAELLQKALSGDVKNTFNMLSIDGDTSTNDMVTVLANGLAGNEVITAEGEAFDTFMKAPIQAVKEFCISRIKLVSADGKA